MLIEGNTTNNNKGVGIYAPKVAHVFKNNVAMDNETWGIWASEGSNGRVNIDGGGNIALGNDGPLGIDLKPQQCYTIRCEGGPGGASDQIAPNTSILESPVDGSSDDVVTFRFSGADNASTITFECRMDSTIEAEFVACVSPATYTLSAGSHTFEVRARDISGNVDPTPASYTWTLVAATGAPTATIDSGPDAVTVDTGATFRFSANRSTVTYECALSRPNVDPVWEDCASPKSYSALETGNWEFRVRASNLSDGEGDVALWRWTIGSAPVPQTVSCGELVMTSIVLENDLINCPGYGLIVGAPNITIDLDSHIIDGMGIDAGILNNGHDNVTIKNGLVHEFIYGIQLNPGTSQNVLTGLRIEASEEAAIALSDADQNGKGNTIRENEILANAVGIALYSTTRGTLIVDNDIAANTAEGILMEFSGDNRVERNQIANAGGVGILMQFSGGNTVVDNTISEHGGEGIAVLGIEGAEVPPEVPTSTVADDNRIEHNLIRDGGGGITITDSNDNVVVFNEIKGNTGGGLVLELANGNVVRGNELSSNVGAIELGASSNNLIEANNASGGLGSGIEIGELASNNIVRDNTASGNGGDGIEVGDSSPVGQGNLIELNTVDSNGGDGIIVEGVGHTVRSNTAQLNAGWGIYSVGAIDGGGNFAAGNIEPEQCFGIVCTIGTVPGAPETWIIDAPGVLNTSTGQIVSRSRNASFTYMGSDETTLLTDLTFECRLDSTDPFAWEDCDYPAEYFNLSPGQHTFEVRAMEPNEFADQTPAKHTWVYTPLPSGVAPEVVIDLTPPAETWLPDAIFTFHSNEPDVTFECRVDTLGWEPCGFETALHMNQGAYEVGLEETDVGLHTFQVRAIDFEGNVGTPASYQWRLMGVLVTFVDGPGFTPASGGPGGDPATGGPTMSTSATISWEVNVADATFECQLDLEPYEDCNAAYDPGTGRYSVTFTGLTVGDHVLNVVGSSETVASNGEQEPAVYEWEIVETLDVVPPETSIERAPGPSDLASTIFEFSGTDDLTPEQLLTFQCQVVDGAAAPVAADWVDCISPFNLLDAYTYEDFQLAPGVQHTFYVRAIDLADPEVPNPQQPNFEGNPDPTPASYSWTPLEDTRPPMTTLAGGPAEGSVLGPEFELPFEFGGLDNATPTLELEFECAVGTAPLNLAAAAWEPCDSPYDASGLDPGRITFAVRAIDLMGLADQSPETRTWTIAAPPVTTILTGPPGRIDPVTGFQSTPFSTSEQAIFTFTSDQPGSTFECSLDGSDFVPCGGNLTPPPTWAAWVVESGQHEVQIRATNSQLVVEEEPAVYEWTVELGPDAVRPNTSVLSGPENGTLETIATFTFTGSDNRTLPADLDFECALDSETVWNSCTSPEEFSDLTRGTHVLRVRAIDAAGNVDASPAAFTWVVAPPPITTVTSGPGDAEEETTSRTATFTFEADVPNATFECWFDGQFNPPQGTPCTSPMTYENLGLGEHLFAVRAIDQFGNVELEWVEQEFMIVPHQVSLDSVPASGTGTTATFEFSSPDADAIFQCSLNGAPFGNCESPKVLRAALARPAGLRGPGRVHRPRLDGPAARVRAGARALRVDDRRPRGAEHAARLLAARDDDEHHGLLRRQLGRPDRALRVQARRRLRRVRARRRDRVRGPLARSAHVHGPGDRPVRQRRPDARRVHVDASPRRRTPNTPVGTNVVVPLGNGATASFFEVSTAGHTSLEPLGGGGPARPRATPRAACRRSTSRRRPSSASRRPCA